MNYYFLFYPNASKVHKIILNALIKEKKILKSYIKTKYNPTNEDIVENLINSLDKVDFKSNVKVSKISNTKMDMVVKEEKNNNSIPAKYVTPIQPKKKLYLTEAEKRRDLEKKAI